jgi:hypothetical protein
LESKVGKWRDYLAREAFSHNPRRAGMTSSAQSRMDFKIFSWGKLPEAMFSMSYSGWIEST